MKTFFYLSLTAILLGAAPLHAEKDNATFPDNETTVSDESTASESDSTRQTSRGPRNPDLDYGAMIEGVDIPTSDVLDAGTYGLNFRLYTDGGLVSRLLMSPFRRVHLGLAADAQNLIGTGDPRMIRPSVYFKLRAFDGTDILPALALGYENQGYLYKRPAKRFLQDGRGLYVVMSHEILVPDMELHGGVNIPKVEDEADVYGFTGITYRLAPSFALLLDYDNIRNGPENRLNIGGRFWVTPYFNVDVSARNVGRNADRGAERVVILNYVGQFPF